MPYSKTSELPNNVKVLPQDGQNIYLAAFNNAIKEYDDEGKASATAWAAVKNKFEKNKQGEWVTKESDFSQTDLNNLLRSALAEKYPRTTTTMGPWVEEIWDDRIVYSYNDVNYGCSYAIVDGKVTFGEPQKVIRKTIFIPIESLRAKYADLIQEVGKRNAAVDADRIKKIMSICQELLASEKPAEESVKNAIQECEDCISWLKTIKNEDGYEFTAEAFAISEGNPSEWKLRLWEDPVKKVTKAQLDKATAFLSPGGYRGQKVTLNESTLPEAKRRIRAEYKKLNVSDIPKWVKEVEVRDYINESMKITEATADLLSKGILPVRIIQPGFNAGKGRFYSEGAVKDAATVFENTKMYANHPTPDEEKQRPERDIRDWVATLKNTSISPQGNAIGEAHIHAGWFKEMAQNLLEAGNLDQLGTSINAIGKGSKQKISEVDTFYVEGLIRGRSVDFVTEPGAGGRAGLTESNSEVMDVLIISLDTLKEVRPDLVEAIKTECESITESKKNQEVKHKMDLETENKALKEANDKLTTENTDLKGRLTEAEKVKAVAAAQVIITETIAKAQLPDAAKAKLTAQFKEATSADGLNEAIKAEVEYISKLAESGKVKGMGPTAPTQKDHEALVESFVKTGMTKEKAEIAAAGR